MKITHVMLINPLRKIWEIRRLEGDPATAAKNLLKCEGLNKLGLKLSSDDFVIVDYVAHLTVTNRSFRMQGYPHPIFGKAIIFGYGWSAPRTSVESLWSLVSFENQLEIASVQEV